jgi:hypothetical protein
MSQYESGVIPTGNSKTLKNKEFHTPSNQITAVSLWNDEQTMSMERVEVWLK